MPRIVGIANGFVVQVGAGADIGQHVIDHFAEKYTQVDVVDDTDAALRIVPGEPWDAATRTTTPSAATVAYEAQLADDAQEQSRMSAAAANMQALQDFATGVTTPANLAQLIAVMRLCARAVVALTKRELRKDARG